MHDGRVGARPMMDVTISVDHRIIDGVGAAGILADVKRVPESPVVLIAA